MQLLTWIIRGAAILAASAVVRGEEAEIEKTPIVAGPSDVIKLTDANFEHLTQASTGATTGDWFVKFFAPWCGHCKKLAPSWEELATELKGTVNVAEVDCTSNRVTCERFDIRGYPTLLHLHHGTYYKHQGPRTVENLKAFATKEYSQSEGTAVPRASLTFMEKALGVVKDMPAATLLVYQASKVGFFSVLGMGAVVGAILKGIQRRCSKSCCRGDKRKKE